MSRLDAERIANALGQVLSFEQIDSTNEYLLQHYHQLEAGALCVAEMQTAGRGRRGRQWFSPNSRNLYFSMLWHYDSTEIPDLSALSLVVSVVIAETCEALAIPDIRIKWPNDIYYQGKKMGGILVESRVDRQGIHLVIGIGLNLGMESVDQSIVTQQWSDLSAYAIDRTELVIELGKRLQTALRHYRQQGFEVYAQRWQRFDLFYHRMVKLITENDEIQGLSLGINEQGELVLQQGEIIRAFSIGEISLRAGNEKS